MNLNVLQFWVRSCVLYPLLDGEISLPSSSYHKRDLPNVSILIIFITFFPLAAPKTFHHVQSVAYITMQMIQQQLEIALVPNTSVGVYHMTEESGHIYTTMLSVAIRSSGCAAQCKKAQCLFFHVFLINVFINIVTLSNVSVSMEKKKIRCIWRQFMILQDTIIIIL